MWKRIWSVVQSIIALALVVAIGALGWYAARAIYSTLSSVPKGVGAPIVLAAGAAGGSLLTYLLQQRGAEAQKLRDERALLCADFIAFFFGKLFASVGTGSRCRRRS